MVMHSSSALVLALVSFVSYGLCYIPAVGTNDTSAAIAGGLNVSDVSQLHLQWFSSGSLSEEVSYQLAGEDTTGLSQGALVHFSESKVNESTPPTDTPWIALVSCDKNATDASDEVDIFTLARDHGAVAALLYSLTFEACVINAEYADPANFDQVFDIFSTKSLTTSHIIEYQYGQIGTNASMYNNYDSQLLNSSGTEINETIASGTPQAPGYLFATLLAYNATALPSNGTNSTTDQASGSGSTHSGSSTAVAMIILYAITGCVSALFCVVIITGAIRAIRHPERYGPRAYGRRGGGDGGLIQSHARGLTRAILDTFPVVKFGGPQANNVVPPAVKDVESGEHDHEDHSDGIRDVEMTNVTGAQSQSREMKTSAPIVATQSGSIAFVPNLTSSATEIHEGSEDEVIAVARPRPAKERPSADEIVPAAIGTETCPICIVDFEEGDDLRVLPCEGRHRFHQSCVDPWLLELSSSCPICRKDFLALENMLNEDPYAEDDPPQQNDFARHSMANRFSRYVRSAMRRRHRLHGQPDAAAEESPTI